VANDSCNISISQNQDIRDTVTAADWQQLMTPQHKMHQVVTLITGSKRRSLLMAGEDRKMFMTKVLTLRQRQQNSKMHQYPH